MHEETKLHLNSASLRSLVFGHRKFQKIRVLSSQNLLGLELEINKKVIIKGLTKLFKMENEKLFTKFYGDNCEYLHNNITGMTYGRRLDSKEGYYVRVVFDAKRGMYLAAADDKHSTNWKFQYAQISLDPETKIWTVNYNCHNLDITNVFPYWH